MDLMPVFQPPDLAEPAGPTTLSAVDCMVALAAQHLEDVCTGCECPRCCVACRAVAELLLVEHLAKLYRHSLARLGIEGYTWQTDDGDFDVAKIAAGWHVPCPVYQMMDGIEGEASGNGQHREDRDGEHPLEGAQPAVPETGVVG